jgi:hypothetical protein
MLARLYQANWDVDLVIERLLGAKQLKDFARKWGQYLIEIVEDPDTLFERLPRGAQGGAYSEEPDSLRHVQEGS